MQSQEVNIMDGEKYEIMISESDIMPYILDTYQKYLNNSPTFKIQVEWKKAVRDQIKKEDQFLANIRLYCKIGEHRTILLHTFQIVSPVDGGLTYINPDTFFDLNIQQKSAVDDNQGLQFDLIDTPVIGEVMKCSHSVIWEKACTTCNANISEEQNNNDENLLPTVARENKMIDFIPGMNFKIRSEKAKKAHSEVRKKLLQKKKLSLVLDLDHTLLHASTSAPPPDRMKQLQNGELFCSFKLDRDYTYYVKFRPYLFEFLRQASELYDLHVFTHGTRSYAKMIVQHIEKVLKKAIFGYNVVTREDCKDINSKNLHNQFPIDDSTVLIIDDRNDVWQQHLPNLIQIVPYLYFRNNREVNNAPGGVATNDQKKNKMQDVPIGNVPSKKIENKDNKTVMAETHANSSTSQETTSFPYLMPLKRIEYDENDRDDELKVVWEKLKRIHHSFFESYSKQLHSQQLSSSSSSSSSSSLNLHVKEFLKEQKEKVLQGVHIVFSGIIPLHKEPEKTEIWMKAEQFGAKCYLDFPPKSKNAPSIITHLIAEKKGTAKVQCAERTPGTYIVHTLWLWDSIRHYKRLNEFDYPLIDHNVQKSNLILPLSENFTTCHEEIVNLQNNMQIFMQKLLVANNILQYNETSSMLELDDRELEELSDLSENDEHSQPEGVEIPADQQYLEDEDSMDIEDFDEMLEEAQNQLSS